MPKATPSKSVRQKSPFLTPPPRTTAVSKKGEKRQKKTKFQKESCQEHKTTPPKRQKQHQN